MVSEHSQRPDSGVPFTTGNYDITTTSATEWAFVTEPSNVPTAGWPIEEKLVRAFQQAEKRGPQSEELKAGAALRRPMPLQELQRLLDDRNSQLGQLGEPQLETIEGFGARL